MALPSSSQRRHVCPWQSHCDIHALTPDPMTVQLLALKEKRRQDEEDRRLAAECESPSDV